MVLKPRTSNIDKQHSKHKQQTRTQITLWNFIRHKTTNPPFNPYGKKKKIAHNHKHNDNIKNIIIVIIIK